MGESVQLTAADGHRLRAWLATPTGTPRGAMVVVQEIFGLNAHIRAVAEGFAADGYLTIAPALFDRIEPGIELGYAQADIERGRALKAASPDDKALLDLAAAIAHVRHAGRVGMVGYCWGGLLTWLAAGKLEGLSAAVPYYGGGMADRASVAPQCPVLGHFGEQDTHIPVEGIQALQRAHAQRTTVHFYPAGHGFNCDQRGSYDAASARLARDRTLAFLRQHLG
jgi:carboxymethylenebutenolidase